MSIALDGSAGITFPSTSVQGDAGIGYGQTWQNMTSSRAINGTSYTNSTTKPIMISVIATATAAATTLKTTIAGNVISQGFGSNSIDSDINSNPIIIPVGATYSVAPSVGSATLVAWWELR